MENQPIIKLTAIIDNHILSFKGWEFETEEPIFVTLYGDNTDHFRLEYNKLTRKYDILVAGFDEWCVHEDATTDFDLGYIVAQCMQQEETHPEPEKLNSIVEYLQYVISDIEEDISVFS